MAIGTEGLKPYHGICSSCVCRCEHWTGVWVHQVARPLIQVHHISTTSHKIVREERIRREICGLFVFCAVFRDVAQLVALPAFNFGFNLATTESFDAVMGSPSISDVLALAEVEALLALQLALKWALALTADAILRTLRTFFLPLSL